VSSKLDDSGIRILVPTTSTDGAVFSAEVVAQPINGREAGTATLIESWWFPLTCVLAVSPTSSQSLDAFG
jgi:hypothetical protein